ncbi:hypothetical protein AGTUEHA105_LOCUS5187 [Agrobacterium tumefaciens]|nr:hypothetical protein AGTUEHA105_LOCUS5187 [Agrobacterium tumefaciens]
MRFTVRKQHAVTYKVKNGTSFDASIQHELSFYLPGAWIGAQQKDMVCAENEKDAIFSPKKRALRSPFCKNTVTFRIKSAYRNGVGIDFI